MKRKSILIILTILVSIVFIFNLIFTTNLGLKSVLYIAKHVVPGKLEIGASEGSMSSGANFKNVHVVLSNVLFNAAEIRILMWPEKLLSRRIFWFDYVSMQNVSIYINKQNTVGNFNSKSILQTLQKFARFRVQSLQITNLNLQYQNANYKLLDFNFVRTSDQNGRVFIKFIKGYLLGDVHLEINPKLDWTLSVVGINIQSDPSVFFNNLNFQFNSKGALLANKYKIDVTVPYINMDVRQCKLTGNLQFYTDDKITTFQQNTTACEALITINGEFKSQRPKLNWMVHIPDLSKLYPTIRGSIQSSGNLKTNPANQKWLAGDLIAKNVKANDLTITAIKGSILLNPNSYESIFRLQATALKISDYIIPNVNLNVVGNYLQKNNWFSFLLWSNRFNQASGAILIKRNLFNDKTKILGKISVYLANIGSLIKPKGISQLSGEVRGQFNIQGAMKNPMISGQFNLLDGKALLKKYGTLIHTLRIQAQTEGMQVFKVNGSFLAGSGSGKITGTMNTKPLSLNVHVDGNNLQFINFPDYKVNISPALIVNYKPSVIDVTGNIVIPSAYIMADYYKNVTELPSEVEVIGVGKDRPAPPSDLTMKIHLVVGKDNFIAYKSLRAILGGDIEVQQIRGGTPTATGVLFIKRGLYRVYNQLLTIHEGRLIYYGNALTNPGINLRAMKSIDSSTVTNDYLNVVKEPPHSRGNIRVGVLAQGTLEAPVITLISYPKMKQEDILSYILFNHSSGNLVGANSLSLLGFAASELNPLQPAAEVGNTNINSISPPTMGLFNPTQMFNFSRPISDHWYLRAETSLTEVGADILYQYGHN